MENIILYLVLLLLFVLLLWDVFGTDGVLVVVDDLFPKIIYFLLDLFVVFEEVHLVGLFIKEVVHVLTDVFEENSDDGPAHLQSNTFMFQTKWFL